MDTKNRSKIKNALGFFMALFFCLSCTTKNNRGEQGAVFHSNIIFPLQTEHVHASTLVELPNGDMLCAWFQGSGERWADDVRIMGARLTQGDTSWSKPFPMADVPGFPDINPVLFLDTENTLCLLWYAVLANQWETSITLYRTSNQYTSPGPPTWSGQELLMVNVGDPTERGIQPDDRFVKQVKDQIDRYELYFKQSLLPQWPDSLQKTLLTEWEQYKIKMDSLSLGKNMLRKGTLKDGQKEIPALLGYPLTRRLGWQTKNKPLFIGNKMVVPLYSDGFDCSLFALTEDRGKSWTYSNPVLGGAGIQPTLAKKKNGTLVAYLRDNGPPPQRMQRTESLDSGLTWTIAKDDILPNPGAGFDMVTLSNGEWLMVFNDTEDGRHNLSVAISDDEGKSWKWKKALENDPRLEKATRSHYPTVVVGTLGMVHVSYSLHRNDTVPGNTIKYASFPVQWVKEP